MFATLAGPHTAASNLSQLIDDAALGVGALRAAVEALPNSVVTRDFRPPALHPLTVEQALLRLEVDRPHHDLA